MNIVINKSALIWGENLSIITGETIIKSLSHFFRLKVGVKPMNLITTGFIPLHPTSYLSHSNS